MKVQILLLVSLALVAGFGPNASGALRAHYEFEGNYNNNITGPAGVPVDNAQIIADAGGNGKAASNVLSLDGSGDYVDFRRDSVNGIGSAITIACWAKCGSLGTSDPIIAKCYGWRLRGSGSGGTSRFSTIPVTNADLDGTTDVTDNQWHHIAGVYDGLNKYLYVDGDLDNSVSCTGLLNTGTTYIFTAGVLLKEYSDGTPYDGYPKQYFGGLIDDIHVFDEALSETQVEYLVSGDCNSNGTPDVNDISAGTSSDCNGNGFPDECDIAIGASDDCNGNSVPDDCDITAGTSKDTNSNSIPDECERQLEAEDATLNGTETYAHAGASGGYRVRYFNETGDYILFDNVVDANYLTITYSLGLATSKQCSVYVDGSDAATAVFVPTGSWDVYSTVMLEVAVTGSVKLQLDADDQTANSDESCASLDKITLSNAEPGTTDWVCENYMDRVTYLFGMLNLDFTGLEAVKTAVNATDWPAACDELLSYYQTTSTYYGSNYREPKPAPGTGTTSGAEDILNDLYTYADITGPIVHFPDGSVDWDYTGPADSVHWANSFCRVYFMNTLKNAYLDTGNINYSGRFDKDMAEFVINYPSGSGEYVWDHLNVGIRAQKLARLFFQFFNADEFLPATKILMLSSIAEHAYSIRVNHATSGNQKIFELNGLARIATGYPEFTDASSWADYVGVEVANECGIQVYPDGVQYELSFSYHNGTTNDFAEIADELGNGGYTVNPVLAQTAENMFNYMAWALRPDGNGPLNGDSPLSNYKSKILTKADVYSRNDWKGMVDYATYPGYAPSQPSAMFPWAGQAIFRSGWDADAHWSFFDIGPFGMGHIHSDKLHISVAAYGRDLIADSGKWHYDNYGDPWGYWREYFVGTFSHNGLIVDGIGQRLSLKEEASSALGSEIYSIGTEFDYARGTTTEYDYQGGYHNSLDYDLPGTLTHTRAVVYVKGKYWVVVDDVDTDRVRNIDVLWQFAPDCTVTVDGNNVKTTDPGEGNIRVVPVAGHSWSVQAVIGQGTAPDPVDSTVSWDVQNPDNGWYSVETRAAEPSYTAIYSAQNVNSSTFAWILVPADGDVGTVTASVVGTGSSSIEISVEVAGQPPEYVTVPTASSTAHLGSHPSGDFDMDGAITLADMAFMVEQWLSASPQNHSGTGKSPDLLIDGTIDFGDFNIFAQDW